jgi:linear primary-alkylsulfatase
MDQKPPTDVIKSAHQSRALPLNDTTDFTKADRGFIAALTPCVVKTADGHVVWENDVYSSCPVPNPAPHVRKRRHRWIPVCGGSPC